jgi:hypothetical protein
MRINELNTSDELDAAYEIPGVGLESVTGIGLEEADEGFRDESYNQIEPAADVQMADEWKELLGLNQVSQGPTQIDPPPRPFSFEGNMRVSESGASRSLRSAPDNRGSASSSPRVDRMVRLLASYQRAKNQIRSRASVGAQ